MSMENGKFTMKAEKVSSKTPGAPPISSDIGSEKVPAADGQTSGKTIHARGGNGGAGSDGGLGGMPTVH